MPTVSLVLMVLAGLLHVAFFALESLMWKRPEVHRAFGVRSAEQAETLAFVMFNQGFYNLFLAIGAFVGVARSAAQSADTLLVFCALFMIGAALVLVASNRQLWRGAVAQGALPLLALVVATVA